MPNKLNRAVGIESEPVLRQILFRAPALSLAIVAALAFLAGCSSKEPEESEPVAAVQAAAVQATKIQQVVKTEAVLFPLHQAAIVPKISAPVRKFYVNRGDQVRAGELLAVLENQDLAASLAENKGSYQQAQADYESATSAALPEQIQKAQLDVESAKEQFTAAQQVYTNDQNLYQQGAMAKKQLDQDGVALAQAKNQFDTAQQHLAKLQSVGEQAQLKSAQGQLDAAKGRYENAEAQYSYSEIRSPIDGVVTDRPLYAGEMASSGSPLLTVMDTSQVVAQAHIPQSDARLLKAGDSAELLTPGGGKDVSGKVTVVSPALDPSSTTVEIWVQATNPHGSLQPGATVNLAIVSKTVPNALVIPKAALLTGSDQKISVMVVGSDGHAHQREVKTGIEEGDNVQIVSGLKKGEVVVTQGAYGLPDNTKVKVEQPEKADAAE